MNPEIPVPVSPNRPRPRTQPMRTEVGILEGRSVRLEPLRIEHLDALCEIGLDPAIWRWYPETIATREEMRANLEQALRAKAEGSEIPFVTIEPRTGKIVGSTRYLRIDRKSHRVEIGWTWIAPAWQRSAINTEAKYLMLRHAFETFGAIRVELGTDALNEKSRNAILRIGATQEGILRYHHITSSGRVRDTVMFSITEAEWPEKKARLEEKTRADPR